MIREILGLDANQVIPKLNLEQIFRSTAYRLTHETGLSENAGWLLGTVFGISLGAWGASSL